MITRTSFRWASVFLLTSILYFTLADISLVCAQSLPQKDSQAKEAQPQENAQELITQAKELLRSRQYEKAAETLRRAISFNDRMTEARAYTGMALSATGQREDALKQLLWVKENGNKSFIEYKLALTEIGRIEKHAETSKQR
jgi:tetratricopeptide (TPR) repeat protein